MYCRNRLSLLLLFIVCYQIKYSLLNTIFYSFEMRVDSHLILYILVCLLLLYLIPAAYLRLKMPFWHTQPVFHLYNLKYWCKPPGQLGGVSTIAANKFVNLQNNEFIAITDDLVAPGSHVKFTQICNFIKDYYVIHKDAIYKPTPTDILAYLQSNNHPSFFNVYQEPRMLFEKGVPSSTTDYEMLGVISARVLNVTLHGKTTTTTTTKSNKASNGKIEFPVYYIDNLCVKPDYRKKGIPPQMIQTLYHRISRANPKVRAYMFKREGKLNAIVPLVCYSTYAFDITIFIPDCLITGAMNIIEIGGQQLNVLFDFIKAQMTKFKCVVLPDMSNLLHLIKSGKLLIYGLIFDGGLIAAYVFRPLELYYETKKAVECIAVISNCLTSEILLAGFNTSLMKMRERKDEQKADILLFEETAHSKPIIAALQKNAYVKCNFKSPTAFFLYNYICYSFAAEKTLLIY